MKVKLLITILFTVAYFGGYAQQAVELISGTPVEVRIISTLNKKGKKEKFVAFAHEPVMAAGKEVLAPNTPITLKVRTTSRSGGRKNMEIVFVSATAADGQRVKLRGSLAVISREATRKEKLETAAINVAWAPFGYLPTETLPKKVRVPVMTVTGDVFVEGNYVISTAK